MDELASSPRPTRVSSKRRDRATPQGKTTNQLSLSFAHARLGSAGPRHASELDIEPLDATFRDSSRAPLHSWFPYLEGYSPQFVDRVRNEYLPGAKRIIEPFAGSGTTPIVLGQAGVDCAYSEVNPAMSFVVQTKLAVLRLSKAQRGELSTQLVKLAAKLGTAARAAEPDAALQVAFESAFGSSVFFDEVALDQVLRLRSLNDDVSAGNQLLGDCLTLAILACLIPSSRLERAGDLRFKTEKELSVGLPLPIDAVQRRLGAQAADLPSAIELTGTASFACDTAGSLHERLDAEWEGVITSPPYLNGTNYIRNARLELWFLRRVASKGDLRRLRDRVVTSGINDVDAQTRWAPVSKGVENVVALLKEQAYDVRIAKMVGGYFSDMSAVFTSLAACLRSGARVCVDIGDSIYAGVHVPTDDLLVEVAEQLGFRTLERVHLRKRISKGGKAVRQQLLVFENPRSKTNGKTKGTGVTAKVAASPAALTKSSRTGDWRAKWDHFKVSMPHQQQPYAKREWGGPAHSMCSYQGKMKPALAHHLVECFSSPGDVVVDPFSGAGTIPFEACRMQRRGFGIDISRLGQVLSLAKVARTDSERTKHLLKELDAALKEYTLTPSDHERAAAVRFNSAVPDYFHPDTFREVIAARQFFNARWDTGPEWALLFACTLHLLHGNRPYALSRRSHPVTPFKPTGDFEYRAIMPRLMEKLERLGDELEDSGRGFGVSVQGDCTKTWPSPIPKADAIITSPPFFDSTRFYMTNWMRFWFVGWEREDFNVQPSEFVENRQKLDLDVYRSLFEAARERLSDTGLFVLHLGQSPKCDMGAELAARVDPWFRVEDLFTEGVEHCESHGIRDKGTVSGHTYLVLAPK
jgi:DNA modification methylase